MGPGEAANLGLAREKFAFDKTQAAKPQWDSASGQFVMPPSAAAPQGGTMVPQGYRPDVKAESKKQQSARTVNDILDLAEPLLDTSTGSYSGMVWDKAMQAFGHSPEGATSVSRLKVLESALMMAQPRMEGPQSNADVILYRQAAANLGDPTVPNEQKKAAAQTIRDLYSKYQSGGSASSGATVGWSAREKK
jgi:hypothetical protein